LESCRFCVTADPDGFAMRATPWLGQRPAVSLQLLQD
jgi:glutamate racemase